MRKGADGAHRWNAADSVTMARMALAVVLVFLPLKSWGFHVVYALAGLTEAMDSWLARRTGTASDFGARLDSIADLLFYGVLLIRLMPVLWASFPAGIWMALAAVLLVRLAAYGVAAVRYRRLVALHTWLNKLTGAAVFLLPFVLAVSTGVGYAWAVCALAMLAALEELAIHIFRPEDRADRTSIFR